MVKKIYKALVISLLVIFSFSTLYAQEAEVPVEAITWYNFEEGIYAALAESKDIIIDFYTDWCHWCHEMDKTTFADTSVISYMSDNFIAIRVNAESVTTNVTFKGTTLNLRQLTTAFGIKGFPSYAFLTEDAEIITVVPGYLPKELFLNILKYIDQQCYDRQISFEQFVEKQGECKD
ncbi:MAG: DUF255 domain-containing protein [Candidatus Celaenobacter antarcticus]|nr:DUF255 domain-containing protein [Candidatus Celaenobacter antarcticus]MDP8315219.1 DUF255 domain-containing protein [Candidatus Celaenobacter antarcticus]